jgi:hypothetical protein
LIEADWGGRMVSVATLGKCGYKLSPTQVG